MATTAEFVFDDYPDDVFTVQLSPVSMRAFFDFQRDWSTPSTMAEFEAEIGRFVDLAHPTWTDDAATFLDHDVALVRAIVTMWLGRVMDVPAPLLAESSDTGRRREHSTETPAAPSSPRSSSSKRSATTRS